MWRFSHNVWDAQTRSVRRIDKCRTSLGKTEGRTGANPSELATHADIGGVLATAAVAVAADDID
jgi:hypothetical protein